jgi:hypothetical protein
MDVVGDDVLWYVRGECEGDGGTECEGADSDSECDMLCVLSALNL